MIRTMMLSLGLIIFSYCNSSDYNANISNPYFLQEKDVQLSPPIINAPTTLFSAETSITIESMLPGSIVRYTVNDSIPSSNSPEAKSPLTIIKSGKYQFRAFHPSFQASDIVTVDFQKLPNNVIEYSISGGTNPSEKYSADGWNSCMDRKRGTSNFSKDWLGFQEDRIAIEIKLNRKERVKGILAGFLSTQGSWIFLPEHIEVYNNTKRVSSYSFTDASKSSDPYTPLAEIRFGPITTDQLTLFIDPLDEIPEWHDGAGTAPWTFIDEIIVL